MHTYITLFEREFYYDDIIPKDESPQLFKKALNEEWLELFYALRKTDTSISRLDFKNKSHTDALAQKPNHERIIAYYMQKCPQDPDLFFKVDKFRSPYEQPQDIYYMDIKDILMKLIAEKEEGVPFPEHASVFNCLCTVVLRDFADVVAEL